MAEGGDAEAAPVPASVGVVGLGLIGGSIAKGLRAACPGIRLVGVTRDPTTAAAAVAAGVCDDAGHRPERLAGVEVAVLCTPVDAMPAAMDACARHAPGALVTDAGSTKAWVVGEGRARLGDRFLGGHPMAGREASGWPAAEASLFAGAVWVLTPQADGQLAAFASWRAAIAALGATVVVADPAEHDAAVALVSHLPMTLSAALALTAVAQPWWRLGAELAASGFRDAVRLAGGEPRMEAAIAATNAAPLTAAIDALLGELGAARERVAAGEDLTAWFASARAARQGWLDGPGGRFAGPGR